MRYRLSGAALIAALFFNVCSASPLKKKTDNLETYREQITKSQVLLLQQDRRQAVQLLVAAIQKEGPKSSSYGDLSKALKQTSEVFLSEKHQNIYETALATFPTSRAKSLSSFKDLLGVDPANSLVLKALIFTMFSLKECGGAEKYRQELELLNPFEEDLKKLQVLDWVCQKSSTEAQVYFNQLDSVSLRDPFWIINRFRLLSLGNRDDIEKLKSLQQESPELIFVQWQIEPNRISKKLLAEKYKNRCHASIPFDKAYEWMDPWACDHLKELEQDF